MTATYITLGAILDAADAGVNTDRDGSDVSEELEDFAARHDVGSWVTVGRCWGKSLQGTGGLIGWPCTVRSRSRPAESSRMNAGGCASVELSWRCGFSVSCCQHLTDGRRTSSSHQRHGFNVYPLT